MTVDTAVWTALGEQNTRRGNLGFGAWLDKGGVYRFPQPFDAAKIPVQTASIALGHIRAPTGGQSSRLADLHPFQHENLWLAHNGLLLNHRAFSDWRLALDTAVDSVTILGGIVANQKQHTLPQAICTTAGQLEGQQACWLWDTATQTLYLWRVMAPIYTQASPTQFLFSSLRPASGHSTLLAQGTVYRLRYPTLALESVGTFDYYNPYQ